MTERPDNAPVEQISGGDTQPAEADTAVFNAAYEGAGATGSGNQTEISTGNMKTYMSSNDVTPESVAALTANDSDEDLMGRIASLDKKLIPDARSNIASIEKRLQIAQANMAIG